MGISRSATVVAAYCEIVAPYEWLKDGNSPHISDGDSAYLCPKGAFYHQERSLIFLACRMRTHRPIVARPQIQPNYGFIKELHAFEACHYAPSSTDPTYRTWKRRHRQDVTTFLNSLSDQTVIISEKLSLSR